MANIVGQKKRIRQDAKKRQRNKAFRSSMRTAIKAVYTLSEDLQKGKEDVTKEMLIEKVAYAFKKLDQACVKGIVHKNFVGRKKSQLSQLLNNI